MSCLGPRALAFAPCQAQRQTSWPWHLCRGMPQHQGQLKLHTRLLSSLDADQGGTAAAWQQDWGPCRWCTGCLGTVTVLVYLQRSDAEQAHNPGPRFPPSRQPPMLRAAWWQSSHQEPSFWNGGTGSSAQLTCHRWMASSAPLWLRAAELLPRTASLTIRTGLHSS